jgi:hypothetical protein
MKDLKIMDNMEAEEKEKLLEISKEINGFADKLEVGFLKKWSYRICCTQLSVFKEIIEKENVEFDEINFETIFNHFKKMEKENVEL